MLKSSMYFKDRLSFLGIPCIRSAPLKINRIEDYGLSGRIPKNEPGKSFHMEESSSNLTYIDFSIKYDTRIHSNQLGISSDKSSITILCDTQSKAFSRSTIAIKTA